MVRALQAKELWQLALIALFSPQKPPPTESVSHESINCKRLGGKYRNCTKLPGAHEDFNHNLRVRCGRESMVCLAMLSIKTSPILANQPLGTYLFLRLQYTGNKARYLKKIQSQL